MLEPCGITMSREARIILDRAMAETGPERWTAPTIRVAAILANQIHKISEAAQALAVQVGRSQ